MTECPAAGRQAQPRGRARWELAGASAAAGLLVAASVPPLGFWPLGIIGLAFLVFLLRDQPAGTRALIGFVGGLGLYGVTISWFAEFNIAGAIASMASEAAFLAAAAALTPPAKGRRAGFVGALVLQDWARTYVPFGGVPLGGVPLGQAAGPLVAAARIGGQLGLTAVAGTAAVLLELLVTTIAERGARAPNWRVGGALAVMFSIVVALPVAGAVAADGRAVGTVRVVLVQGGGPRGLRAVESSADRVFHAQVAESARVQGPADLIVWPEDVVALTAPLSGSPEEAAVGAVARAHAATLLAGVTEDVGPDKFRNAIVEWSPAGVVTARYDKVHRVPFGEYVPLRSLVKHIVSLDAIPRDAIAGHGSGELATPAGPVAILISYEVFFPDRARSAVGAGGQVLLVPTNTASYTTTQVSAAELAALRIRAWSTGRDVAMVAPTGWSAVVTSRGRLLQRSRLEAPAVLEATLTRRTGRTPWVRWGDLPTLVIAAVVWPASLASARPAVRARS